MARAGSAPSQRQLRVGEAIRHALADMLSRGDVYDEAIANHAITVSEVRMSPDLKLATAYVMPLGGADLEPVLAALNRHRRYIRGAVGKAVNLKYAPEVRFRADVTFDEANRIERLLNSPAVRQDVRKQAQDD